MANYFKKSFIIGIIAGSLLSLSFLGYLYYITEKNTALSKEMSKSKTFKDLKIKLTDLNGNTVDLTKFSDKTIFINFWATWCAPCMEEMPVFQKVYNDKEIRDKYVFILVADHDAKIIQNFKAKKGYDFIFVKSEVDLKSKLGALPTTYILDNSLHIIFTKTGSFQNDSELRKVLNQNSK
ncbi:TlpA family protein disulfide reductase [Flavobacterium sp. N502540]|uniref:TlpA family protein disulfide reductase n=1 Tax=Flavobacterium sp. N502540 TaxID=2986838 RepID=UPI0022254A49|nr:TlpA disulfide reductase family protein [Flavobacterium sp. N502540]